MDTINIYDEICAKIRNSRREGKLDFSSLSNQMLDLLNSKSQERKKLSYLLSDVVPYDNLKECFILYDCSEYDPDSDSLKPFDLRTMVSKEVELPSPKHLKTSLQTVLTERAKVETKIGHILRFQNSLAVFRSVCPRFKDLRCIKMMKSYLDMIGDDPFYEDSDGGIHINYDFEKKKGCYDLLVASRFSLLLNSAFVEDMVMDERYNYYQSTKGTKLSDVIFDMARYLFKSPIVNTLLVKDRLTVIKTATFSVLRDFSKSEIPQWDEEAHRALRSYKVVHPTFDDRENFKRQKLEIQKDIKELEGPDYKLGITAEFLASLIMAPVNTKTIAVDNIVSFLECLIGYLRTNDYLTYRELAKVKPAPEHPGFERELLSTWMSVLEGRKQQIVDKTVEDWYNDILDMLTTKSAGGDSCKWRPGKSYTDKYTDEEFKEDSERWSSLQSGVKFSNKVMNFLYGPNGRRWFEPSFVRKLLIDIPGKIFSRNVPARKTRPIFAVHAALFILELFLGREIMRYLSKHRNVTMTKETSSFLANHSWGMIATSSGRHFIVITDFSGFDQTEQYSNVRRIAITALETFAKENPQMIKLPGWEKNAAEVMAEIWLQYRRAKFEDLEDLDQVFSGEFLTAAINTITNLSNWQYSVKKVKQLAIDEGMTSILQKIDLESTNYQVLGDDFVTIMEQKAELTSTEITWLADKLELCAGDNGLKINATKASIGRTYYEYLKKKCRYGYGVPRILQMQLFCGEKLNSKQPIQQMISGYAQTVYEWISRGGSLDRGLDIILFTFIIRGNVRYKDKDVLKQVQFPIETLFLPKDCGGIAYSPFSCVGAARDNFIPFYYGPTDIDRLIYAAEILHTRTNNVRDELAESIIKSGFVDFGLSIYETRNRTEKGRQRVTASVNASKLLDEYKVGYPVEWGVIREPYRTVKRAVKDIPQAYEVAFLEYSKVVREMQANEKMLEKHYAKQIPKTFIMTKKTLEKAKAMFRISNHVSIFEDENADFEPTYKLGKLPVIIKEGEIDEIDLIGLNKIRGKYSYEMVKKYKYSNAFIARMEEDVPIANYQDVKSLLFENEVVCPVAGLDPHVAKLLMTIGVSSEGELKSKEIANLTQTFREHGMPMDITLSALMKTCMSLYYAKFNGISATEVLSTFLTYIGIDPNFANSVSHQFMRYLEYFYLYNSVEEYYVNDVVTGYMDLSRGSQMRIADFQRYHKEPLIDALCKQLSLGLAVTQNMYLPFKRVTTTVVDEVVPLVLEDLKNREFTLSEKLFWM